MASQGHGHALPRAPLTSPLIGAGLHTESTKPLLTSQAAQALPVQSFQQTSILLQDGTTALGSPGSPSLTFLLGLVPEAPQLQQQGGTRMP